MGVAAWYSELRSWFSPQRFEQPWPPFQQWLDTCEYAIGHPPDTNEDVGKPEKRQRTIVRNNALNDMQDIARTQMKDAEWSIEVLMGRDVKKDLRLAERMVEKGCGERGCLF
jgi:hypothetical protein